MTRTVATSDAGSVRLTRRQAELLDQLEGVFLAEGFGRFTLDDLALRLRCSKSTLYALAGSKEQLAARVIRHFFRKATEAVETRTATEEDPALRVTAYLTAVAQALAPASRAFYRDLDGFAPGRAVYEQNTAIAAVSVVHGDVPEGARYGGVPARPMAEWLRELAAVRRLAQKDRSRVRAGS